MPKYMHSTDVTVSKPQAGTNCVPFPFIPSLSVELTFYCSFVFLPHVILKEAHFAKQKTILNKTVQVR